MKQAQFNIGEIGLTKAEKVLADFGGIITRSEEIIMVLRQERASMKRTLMYRENYAYANKLPIENLTLETARILRELKELLCEYTEQVAIQKEQLLDTINTKEELREAICKFKGEEFIPIDDDDKSIDDCIDDWFESMFGESYDESIAGQSLEELESIFNAVTGLDIASMTKEEGIKFKSDWAKKFEIENSFSGLTDVTGKKSK